MTGSQPQPSTSRAFKNVTHERLPFEKGSNKAFSVATISSSV